MNVESLLAVLNGIASTINRCPMYSTDILVHYKEISRRMRVSGFSSGENFGGSGVFPTSGFLLASGDLVSGASLRFSGSNCFLLLSFALQVL